MQRTRLLLSSSLAVLSSLAACSYGIDGPTPTISAAVDPNLVCNEQLTTPVAITGTGFSPLPVDTATEPARLELPNISLTRTKDLAGAAAMGMEQDIPDDPETQMGQVRWTSQTAIGFDVTESLMLEEGVYQLAVENPNRHRAQFDDALVVVPPPELESVEPMAICTDQFDVMLEVTGTGFLEVGMNRPMIEVRNTTTTKTYTPSMMTGCMDLPAPANTAKRCTGMIFTVPRQDLPVGTYMVTITNPPPAACATTEAVTLEVVPPPDLTDTMPSRICTGGGSLNLLGSGFRMGATVTIGDLDASSVAVQTGGEEALATFGVGLDPGTYDITIENPEGCTDSLMDEITVTEGPIVFWADPPVVYNGITTQVTVYASGIADAASIASVRIALDGAMGTELDYTFDSRGRIQALLPSGTAAGSYDIVVEADGCAATLPDGLDVRGELNLTLDRIDPPFGATTENTPVTIFGDGFTATPRVYLNPETPTATTVATALRSVGFVDDARITALVPSGLPTGVYDVLVVNPTGEVGRLAASFTVTAMPPPTIDTVTPGQIDAGASRTLTIAGNNFRVPMVSYRCNGATATPSGTLSMSTASSATVTLDATSLADGDLCVVRITNGDGSYGEFSVVAITTPASNIQPFEAGTSMTTARRSPAAATGRATRSARFLYAIGGDDGATSGALDTSEAASVDVFGEMGAWFEQPYPLPTPRTHARAQRIGRFIYLIGGDAGSGAVADVSRAEILDPLLAPVVTDVSARRGMGTGLGAGIWTYRVSAVFDAADPLNPGGESLASDPVPVNLPMGLPDTLLLTIDWSEVEDAVGYRVYRSPAAGDGAVQLIAELPATTRSYEDTGTTPMAGTPLPLGAHGQWVAMPSLGTPRAGFGLAHAVDPANADIHYLYAIAGRNAMGTRLATYEFLSVTVNGDRDHTVAASWTAGMNNVSVARDDTQAFSVDAVASSLVTAPASFVYLGPGSIGAMQDPAVDVAQVNAGGQLAAWGDAGDARRNAGYAAAAGNDFLYIFGGGPTATDAAISSEQCGPGDPCTFPATINWNNEGVSLVAPRFLPGSVSESSFIFVVGGSSGTGALMTTESTVL